MGTENLNCEEIKKQLIKEIDSKSCKEILVENNFRLKALKLEKANVNLESIVADPISEIDAERNKLLFNNNYEGMFRDEFTIGQAEINRVIGENWGKKFLHIFFINHPNVDNELSIVLRFSRIETFDDTNWNLDLSRESAYWLADDGTLIPFNSSSERFTILKDNYITGIGARILNSPDAELTYYVTYEMSKILSFNGFEQDIVFDVMCVYKNAMRKLGVQTFVRDNDRIHHYELSVPIYEGYYDLGNLKP